MRTGYLYDPLFERHDTGPGHPEHAARAPAARRALEGLDLLQLDARDATETELHTVHAPGFPALLRRQIEAGVRYLDADTAVCADSYAVAARAAGAALALGEAWIDGRIDAGFAAVRPPGHHACSGRAMGFCLFNNVALLARQLHTRGKRVCIVDWDVHHGNGTQDILWDEPGIGFLSLHQYPFYPYTGAADETGAGNILNLPLRAESSGTEYRGAFGQHVLPWIEQRDPEVIVVSAGFDAHRHDPLAKMDLVADDYAEFTRMLADRPILSVLEGGYDVEALADSIRAHVEALIAA